MKIVLSPDALAAVQYFKKHEPKIAARIKQLVKNISSEPYTGLGKPEPLKHALSGYWSRRINHEHRLVYKVEGDTLYVVSCRYHYSK